MTNTVGFPGLGIGPFEVNPVAIPKEWVGKDIYWYGIIIAIGFICAVLFAVRRAKQMDIKQDVVYDLVVWGLPTAIICARLYYVLGALPSYQHNPMNIFAIWDGGLSIYGAVIGASLVGFIYSKRNKLHMGKVFDLAAPCLMIGQIIGRLGNFMNVEVYGRLTGLPWRMYLNDPKINMTSSQGVHPLFLYEQLWMIVGLFGILAYEKHKKRNGKLFLLYILWYSLGRVWMELLRDNEFVLKLFADAKNQGGMPLSLVTAIVLVVCAAGALVWLRKRKNTTEDILSENSDKE